MASSRRMRGAFDSEPPAPCPSAARRENRVPSRRRLFPKLDTRNKPSTCDAPSGRWNHRPGATDVSSHSRFFRCRMDPTEPVLLARYPPPGRFLQASSARETRQEPQGRLRTRHTQERDNSFLQILYKRRGLSTLASQAVARRAVAVAGFRAASHRAASDARAKVAMERTTLGSR